MDTSPEKDSTTVNNNDNYELKLEEEDSPMMSNEVEESPSPPRGDGQLISVDVIMTSDEEDDLPLKLDATMVPAEDDDDSPPSPAAEDDDQSPLKRRSAATGENGSSTITSGESGSWDSELDTSFQNSPNGVNIESNGVDEYEEYEVTLPQQAEEEYEISLQQAEGDCDISSQPTEGDYGISLEQVVVEPGNGAVQSYSKSEEERAAYTTEAFAGTSSEIEWSEFDVNRDYLASRFKNVDIDALMRTAFRDKQIQGKQIEYREGSSVEEIGLRDGETVIYEAEESDEELVELEFEAAVEKIHKHEDYGMYCPNCSNRITRVVLRRKIKQRRVLVASGRDRRDLLGCLSCFSIFIPSGNQLNPFKIFGGKRGRDETTQLPTSADAVPSSGAAVTSLVSDVPTTDSSHSTQVEERKIDCFWFLKKRRVDDQSEGDLTSPLLQDSSPATTVTRDEAIKQEGMQQTSTTTTTFESIQKGGVQTSTTSVTFKSKDVAMSQGGEVQTSTTTVKPGITSKPRDEAIKPARGGNIQVPQEELAADGTAVVETDTKQVKAKGFDVFWFLKRERTEESDLRTPLIPAAAQVPSSFPAFSAAPGIMQTSTTTVTSRQPRDVAIKQEGYLQTSTRDEATETMRKPEGVAIAAAAVGSVPQIASRQESIQDMNVIIDVCGKQGEVIQQAKPPVQPQLEIRGDGTSVGGDVRITVEETQVETQTIGSTDVAVSTTRTEIVTDSRPSVWFDILKSIVYGGLMESVISLFVVSLAIASNATTMNVVAIGSAFVVGGFILLLHNLRVLRYGDSTQTSEQRYEVQLGKIDRFPLHALVAVVSHVVFGLIPPVIFGFTFRGDMEFKMISVGVASFICIFILAISLAYVRGEQTFVAYFKTVLYYVFLAAIASAAAFGIAYLLQDPLPCPAALDL